MADMAMAAAAAAGHSRLPERPGRGRGGRGGGGRGRGGGGGGGRGRGGGPHSPRPRAAPYTADAAEISLLDDDEAYEWVDDEDGPSVDDLEVAAAAAAEATAALERVAVATAGGRRPPGVLDAVELGAEPMDADSQEGGSEAATTSDDEDGPTKPTSGGRGSGAGAGAAAVARVAVALVEEGGGGGRVRLSLSVVEGGGGGAATAAAAAAMGASEGDDDDDPNFSSSDNDSEIFEPAQLREIVERLQAEEDSDGEGGGQAPTGAEALGLPAVAAPLDGVDIGPDDALTPAGAIASLVEDMIVVQAPADTNTLSEGAVLCLADHTPLGRVEDVFGPVTEPLYALRCPAGSAVPGGATPGAPVFSVDKYATFVQPASLKSKGYDAFDPADEEEPETAFSDDEAEQAFLKAKAQEEAAKVGPTLNQQRAPPHRSGRGGRGYSAPRPNRGGHGRGGWGPGRGGNRPMNAVQAAMMQANPILPTGSHWAPPPGYAPPPSYGPPPGMQAPYYMPGPPGGPPGYAHAPPGHPHASNGYPAPQFYPPVWPAPQQGGPPRQ